MKTLEAVTVADNFAEVLKKVRLRQESFEIVAAGVPCAYLTPASGRLCFWEQDDLESERGGRGEQFWDHRQRDLG